MQRRLAAIVVADTVGFSRMMERDEAETFRRVRHMREELAVPIVTAYGGRIIKTTGDGFLAEFSSTHAAVDSALAIQQALRASEGGVEDALQLRIGINLGDIIVDGDDVAGDGVNLAARLEPLAPPGGVCISAAVHDQLRGTLNAVVVDIGQPALKNISRPVRAYVLVPDKETAATFRATWSKRDAEAKGARGGRLPSTSIAVFPFKNLSGEESQRYFADGIAEDIIAALGRFKSLSVLAGSSSFLAVQNGLDARALHREFGVRYVLEGSVRRGGEQIRLMASLVDAATGAQLWTQRFEGPLRDTFEMQDEITERVVNIISPTIEQREIDEARAKPPHSLSAYDLCLQARPMLLAVREAKNRAALELLEQALALDPESTSALCLSAFGLEQRLSRGWPPFGATDARTAVERARKAVGRPEADSSLVVLAANALLMVGREFDLGFRTAVRALEANPSNAFVMQHVGFAHICAGDLTEALRLFRRARELSPHAKAAAPCATGEGMALFFLGRDAEALQVFQSLEDAGVAFDMTYVYWTCAAAHTGDAELTASVKERLLKRVPGGTVQMARSGVPIRDPARMERIVSGLRLAGVPDA